MPVQIAVSRKAMARQIRAALQRRKDTPDAACPQLGCNAIYVLSPVQVRVDQQALRFGAREYIEIGEVIRKFIATALS